MKERILAVHNQYQIAGGEDRSHRAEVDLLRHYGHEVDEWVENNQRVDVLGAWRTGLRTVWSQESYHKARHLMANKSYNAVLIQNFFPLISPSIYYAAKSAGVPIIQTLRNYRLMCPNALFFRDGHVCEDCLGKFIPWASIKYACYRDDHLASATVATMLVAHRLMGTWHKMVTIYVALTEFARKKFLQGGFPAEKIMMKPNFLAPDPGLGNHDGEFALYVGRLSAEKGLDVLISAWKSGNLKVPLYIVGDGPLCDLVVEAEKSLSMVRWLGKRSHEEVLRLMKQAKLFVFPSMCYEGLPRTIVEAYAVGLPVIASDHGSMSTLVDEGRTGLLFRPGNSAELTQKIQYLWGSSHRLKKMQRMARQAYEEQFTAEQNYNIFRQILEKAQETSS